MIRAVTPRSAREIDPLAVNSTTLHQYYNTVQSGAGSEHMVDAAMARRKAMALQAYRRRGYSGGLKVAVTAALVLLLVSAVWLLG